jgi:hypothetical protein
MRKIFTSRYFVVAVLTGIVAFAASSFREAPGPTHPKEGPKNLKILPKNIDHASLIAIMHDFEHALNFRCEDCHAASATNPKRLDFASDANPHKDVARHMMKMMEKINRKYFKVKGDFASNYVNAKYEVTCYTCHHGDEHPMTFPGVHGKEHMAPPSHDHPASRHDQGMPPPPPPPGNG